MTNPVIHLYFLFLIGPFPESVVGNLPYHFKFIILRWHLFMKVCIIFNVFCVIIYVSGLYSNTDMTFELNIIRLVFTLIFFAFQIFPYVRKAAMAFCILVLILFCGSYRADFTAQVHHGVGFFRWFLE